MAASTALAGQAFFSAQSLSRCTLGGSQFTQGPPSKVFSVQHSRRQHTSRSLTVRAAEEEESAPQAGQEEVRRIGRGPPSSDGRRWGYTEFDSAGQKNIYAVEPTIYVADNGLSTGKKGTDGQGNSTLVLLGVGAAVAVGAFASLNLLGNAPTAAPSAGIKSTAGVDVPPLSFYIEKFSQKPSLDVASVSAPELSSGAIVAE